MVLTIHIPTVNVPYTHQDEALSELLLIYVSICYLISMIMDQSQRKSRFLYTDKKFGNEQNESIGSFTIATVSFSSLFISELLMQLFFSSYHLTSISDSLYLLFPLPTKSIFSFPLQKLLYNVRYNLLKKYLLIHFPS